SSSRTTTDTMPGRPAPPPPAGAAPAGAGSEPGAAAGLVGHVDVRAEAVDPGEVAVDGAGVAQAGVALVGPLAVGKVQHVGGGDRGVLHPAGPSAAQPLVLLARRVPVGVPGELVGQ